MKDDADRTASLMTPAKLAQVAGKSRAPVSPAAWSDRMATDAGHAHVRRLGELRAALQVQCTQPDCAPLVARVEQLAAALPRLDIGLMQQKPGLFSRLGGKSRTAIAEFASQYDRIEDAMEKLSQLAKALQGRQREQAPATDRTLLEIEVEFRAIDKIIDQGARWLQDMRSQLKAREAQEGGDDARRQVADDAQRCELLNARLKNLRALSTATHKDHQQGLSTAARRAGLVQKVHGELSARMQEWRMRLSPLANAAHSGEVPALSLEGPMDSHRDLQLCVKDVAGDGVRLQADEQAWARGLDLLGDPLKAAG